MTPENPEDLDYMGGLLSVFILYIKYSFGIMEYSFLFNYFFSHISLHIPEYMLPGISPEDPGATPTDKDIQSDSFKVFIRHLPEFQFWKRSTLLIIITNILSFFPIFDIPVKGSILLIYFIVLTVVSLRTPIKQMIKSGKLPWKKEKEKI